jgi:hypothetical protein
MAIHADPTLFHRTTGRFRQLVAKREKTNRQARCIFMLEAHKRLAEHVADVLPKRFATPGALSRWYDRVDNHVNLDDLDNILALRCPPGPFPDDPSGMIRQIRDGKQALATALQFDNCICTPAYRTRMATGKCYLYSVQQAFGLQGSVFEVAIVNEGSEFEGYGVVHIRGFQDWPIVPMTRAVIRAWVRDRGGILDDEEEPVDTEFQLFLFNPLTDQPF